MDRLLISTLKACTSGRLLRSSLGVAAIAATFWASGCNDPYSQRRIERRWGNVYEIVADFEKHDENSARRLREADTTFHKWWRRDSERFERRVPTIGDYFW